jgi:rare lipoprotein A
MNMSPRNLLWKGRSNPALVLVSACAALCALGCSAWAQVYSPAPAAVPPDEVGVASWYGYPYHGRQAANGEIYDMRKLTAAHRTLPFGTRVRVHSLENDSTVDVEITDRGPFVDGRLIDLSRAAARILGMQRVGIARVRIEMMCVPATASGDSFAVQVGAFRIRANAERLRAAMELRFGSAIIVPRQGNPVLWRVVTGRYRSPEAARTFAQQIRSEESDSIGPAFIQRLDD